MKMTDDPVPWKTSTSPTYGETVEIANAASASLVSVSIPVQQNTGSLPLNGISTESDSTVIFQLYNIVGVPKNHHQLFLSAL